MIVINLNAIYPSDTPSNQLADKLENVTNDSIYHYAHWGMLVQDLDSRAVLYNFNSQEIFVPGSTTKLFTVAAALNAYGPNYRFKTPVYINGPVNSAGTLHGDIILVTIGDMTMGGRTTPDDKIAYTNIDHCEASVMDDAQLTKTDPLAGLDNLTSQIASAGIKRVDGNVIIDDRLFESVMIGSNLITPSS